MNEKTQFGCADFEALLAEAAEDALGAEPWKDFKVHAGACSRCAPLWEEARAGRTWLRTLEVAAPPTHLLRNILLATSGLAPSEAQAPQDLTWKGRFWHWLLPPLESVWQPRFAMSFSMAFFSLSLILQVSGVKIENIRLADLRPSTLRQSVVEEYYSASARFVKYYENMRLVYELQTRVEKLRDAATQPQVLSEPAKPAEQPKPKPQDDNTSGQPDTNQNQKYSQERLPAHLASHPRETRPLEFTLVVPDRSKA